MPKFIALRVRGALVLHGYTPDNEEVLVQVQGEDFADKLIAIERIQSATERYLMVSAPHGRAVYWEYEGGLVSLQDRLAAAGCVIA